MLITDFKGKQLLDQNIIDQIQKNADLIVQNKDVTQAWRSLMHLKEQISSLTQEEIAPILDKYRRITTKLKALALALLSQEEVEHLLKNNLEFLDTQSEEFLSEGLVAWLATKEDEKQESLKQKLSSIVDKDSAFAPKILSVLKNQPKEIIKKQDPFLDKNETNDLHLGSKKTEELKPFSSVENDSESVARQIFSQANSKISEEDFVRRAKALIKSRLKDVRTKVDIAGYLSRPFQVGGLGLSAEVLQNAENLIEQSYLRTHSSTSRHLEPLSTYPVSPINALGSVPLPKSETMPKIEPKKVEEKTDPQKEIDKLIKSEASDGFDLESILKNRADKSNSVKPVPTKTESVKPEISIPLPEKKQEINSMRNSVQMTQSNKVRLDDIKTSQPTRQQNVHSSKEISQSKPSSLSDEFSSISISDFRSYGKEDEAIQKILRKIKSLEDDSLASKFSAVRNFKQSPLYKQYISIGEASLLQGKKLSEAILDVSINPDKITENEFFAISDLNSKMR